MASTFPTISPEVSAQTAGAAVRSSDGQVFSSTVQPQVTRITDVRVEEGLDGPQVTLEISNDRELQISPTQHEQIWSADIHNAQLQLESEQRLQIMAPVDKIQSVSVISLDANTIRVEIVGDETDAPDVQIAQTAGKLTLRLNTSSAEAVHPEPSETVSAAQVNAQQIPEPSESEESEESEEPEEAEESEEAEEPLRILVTAERFEESLQDVPISITTLSSEEIEDIGSINTTSDISRYVPNLNIFKREVDTVAVYNIRGLGNSFLGSPAVGLYIDDVPASEVISFATNLFDLERIEVLRGPQGTLYGQNTSGGVINIITKPPTNEWQVRTFAGVGDPGIYEGRLLVNGPIVEDNLFFRLSGAYRERDGFLDNVFLDTNPDTRQSFNGRLQLLWTPAEDWDISLGATYEDVNNGAPAVVSPSSPNLFEVEQDFDGESDTNANTQSLRVVHRAPDFTLTSITARRDWRQDPYIADFDQSPLDAFRGFVVQEIDQFSQEVRLQSPRDSASDWRWLIGAYYQTRDYDTEEAGTKFGQDAGLFGAIPDSIDRQVADLDNQTYAVFSQATVQLSERLSLTGGLRLEHERRDIKRARFFDTPLGSSEIEPRVEDEADWTELLPKLAVEYRFSPSLGAYASVTRGFKSGGFSPNSSDPEFLQFDPERTWNFETGVKSSWLDERLTANLALFYISADGYQVLRNFSPNVATLVNAADADIFGLELETRARPTDGLDLVAGIGVISTRFSDFIDPVSGQDFSGNEAPYAPALTYNLAAQYRDLGGLFGRVELQGTSSYFLDDANELGQDAYALLNARIGYEWSRSGVYLYANNLLDEKYLTAGFETFRGVGDRRTFGIQVKTEF
ncbi:MAG: TonB-dependent receptor [Cyanobacteria bacterium P01_H01_bin.21]